MPTPTMLIEGSDRSGYSAWYAERPDLVVRAWTVDQAESDLRKLLREHKIKAPTMVQIEQVDD